MVKTTLTLQEIELVRRRVLAFMQEQGWTSEMVARRSPWLRADTLRKYLACRRCSATVAAELVRCLPALGLVYRPPAVVDLTMPDSSASQASRACRFSAS